MDLNILMGEHPVDRDIVRGILALSWDRQNCRISVAVSMMRLSTWMNFQSGLWIRDLKP